MNKSTLLALLIVAAAASCSTASSWPVAPHNALTTGQLGVVSERFELASRVQLGSDTDVLELTQLALKEIPKMAPHGSDPSKSKVVVDEVRWIDRNTAMLLVLQAWEERGGVDSATGLHWGGRHRNSYIVVSERFPGGWRHLRTYQWLYMSAVS